MEEIRKDSAGLSLADVEVGGDILLDR
jgi:hypothetical protein